MIHWRSLSTQGRINAIRSVWREGCSAAQIAATFDNVTRNSVIGIYHRYGQTHLSDMPLQSPPLSLANRARKQRTYSLKPALAVRPPKPEILEMVEYQLAGKPMMMLQARECRFSVNNAGGDELHLFCGRPAGGAYCSHHKMRAYQPHRAA